MTQRKEAELKSGNHDELGTIFFLNYHRYSIMPELSVFQVPLKCGTSEVPFCFLLGHLKSHADSPCWQTFSSS